MNGNSTQIRGGRKQVSPQRLQGSGHDSGRSHRETDHRNAVLRYLALNDVLNKNSTLCPDRATHPEGTQHYSSIERIKRSGRSRCLHEGQKWVGWKFPCANSGLPREWRNNFDFFQVVDGAIWRRFGA